MLTNDADDTLARPPKSISFGGKINGKKSNDFNYLENLQKYGLDDSSPNDQNLTGVQGSYLSFLLLRHLKIRDLKRQVCVLLSSLFHVENSLIV